MLYFTTSTITCSTYPIVTISRVGQIHWVAKLLIYCLIYVIIVLMYGSEVWAVHKAPLVVKVQIDYCKMLLNIKDKLLMS